MSLIDKLKERYASRYLRDIAWQMSGNGLAQVLGIISMPIITRIYTPADFATLNLFSQAVMLIAILLTWRFEYLIVLPKEDPQAYTMLSLIFKIGACTAAVLTITALLTGKHIALMLGDSGIAHWIALAPLTAWLTCMSIGCQQALQRRRDFRNTGISEIINKGGYVLSALTGAIFHPNTIGLMVSSAVGTGAKTIWLWRLIPAINTEQPKQKENLKNIIREYGQLAGSTSFASMLGMLSGAAPMVFIAKEYGVETLGQFGLVVSTLYLPSSLLGNAIGQVYYQRAAELHANGNQFGKLWSTTAWQLAKIGAPMYAMIAVASPWAYPFVFGEEWKPAGEFAMILAIAAGMAFITSPLDRTCLIVKAWWYPIVWNTTRTATTFATIWLASYHQWQIEQFLIAITMQMTTMYLVDWVAGGVFSTTKQGASI